jgi:hypothetical protein
MSKTVSILMCGALIAACGKKKDDAGTASAKPTEGGGPMKLAKLGLAIDVPGEATAGDGMGEHAVMIQGSGVGAMQVELAKTPQSLDEARSDAGMYSPRNIRTEKLADGWLMTFENSGGAGTNYWVASRRDLGGASYTCGTTGADPDQAKAVAGACKSLRK